MESQSSYSSTLLRMKSYKENVQNGIVNYIRNWTDDGNAGRRGTRDAEDAILIALKRLLFEFGKPDNFDIKNKGVGYK